MKLHSIVIALVLLFNASVALAEPVREVHLGISPFLSQSQRRQFGLALPELMLEPTRLAGGTRVVIWDAWQLVRIADVTIPVRDFDTKRARAIKLQAPLRAVGQWLRGIPSREAGVPIDSGAVKAPEWLFEASGSSGTVGVRVYLLIGSPLYRSPSEPGFDMGEDARYPSDGHLALGLRESVFGVAEKTGRLDRAMVHWCHLDQAIWVNELHRHTVTRFWTLFVQGQGGTLGTFGADLPAVFTRASQANLPPVLRAQVDPADDKPLMRTAAPRAIPLWLQNLGPGPTNSAPPISASANTQAAPTPSANRTPQVEATLVPEPVPVPIRPVTAEPTPVVTPVTEPEPATPVPVVATPPAPAPAAVPAAPPPPNPFPVQVASGKTGIGIAWPASVDLDIYVKASPRASELYFRRTITAEGRYYHDYRNRNLDVDYEYVELKEPVDIRQVEVWVNYYKGRTSNISGKVCVHYQGKTFIGDFTLKADRGNRGFDSYQRAASPYWTKLNVLQVVGLEAAFVN